MNSIGNIKDPLHLNRVQPDLGERNALTIQQSHFFLWFLVVTRTNELHYEIMDNSTETLANAPQQLSEVA